MGHFQKCTDQLFSSVNYGEILDLTIHITKKLPFQHGMVHSTSDSNPDFSAVLVPEVVAVVLDVLT